MHVPMHVYGSPLRLPGELLAPSYEPKPTDIKNLLQRLRKKMNDLQAIPTARQSSTTSYMDPRLNNCTHVFLRCDKVKRSLQPPYDGPFKVLKRVDKTFIILLNGKEEVVSVDRLKAASVEKESTRRLEQTSNQKPKPATTENTGEPQKIVNPKEDLSSSSSSPSYKTTRSGRHVRFPKRLASFHHY